MTSDSMQLLQDRFHALADELRSLGRIDQSQSDALAQRAITTSQSISEDEVTFIESLALYRALCEQKSQLLHECTEIAAAYETMDEFWVDADRQELGLSQRTFWDTYEHGRRRQLEAFLAQTYGSESSLLVNTGMSAVDVALRSADLKAGDVVLTQRESYFETSVYFKDVLQPTGIRIERRDMWSAAGLNDAVSETNAKVVFLETATNCPPCQIAPPTEVVSDGSVEIVIDNSLFSHGIRWFDHLRGPNVLIAESAIKYLTGVASAGVLYGSKSRIDRAREYARNVGQQLQERAFNHIQLGEIATAADKVRLQSSRASLFLKNLDEGPWKTQMTPAMYANERSDWLGEQLHALGGGALVFLTLDEDSVDKMRERHRRILNGWQTHMRDAGEQLGVRAGYGWDRSTARCYESARLNQAHAPQYLRLSVGIEPESYVLQLADALNKSAANN